MTTHDHDRDHPLDRATALEPRGPNMFHGRTWPEWANMVGPFGGTTASAMLSAILHHPERHGDPLSLTLNFAGPVAEGDFDIEARPVRTNRTNQHWMLEMRQGEEVVTTATALTGLRRDTWSDSETTVPHLPDPESLPRASSDRGVRWIANYDMRFDDPEMSSGMDAGARDSSTTTMWIRDHPQRPLDHVALTSICDSFFPRMFLRLGRPLPTGTVSLTIFYLGTAEEIAAVGTDFVLGQAHADRFHGGYHNESARVFSRDGTLLALANQLMFFKT